MREDDLTYRFKYVVDGYPVFPSGFNTDVFAVIFDQPICQSSEIAGESGKPAPFVRCYAFAIGCRDTSDEKGFVDIDATADLVHNPESHVLSSSHRDMGMCGCDSDWPLVFKNE
jgi:hypothetical protein